MEKVVCPVPGNAYGGDCSLAKQKIPLAAPANPPQLVLKPSAALRASHISSTALGVVNAAVWRGCVLLLAV